MESRNGLCLYLIILTLSCVTVVISKDCPVCSRVKNGERIDGKVECDTFYTKVGCTPVAVGVSEDYICELDVVLISVALASPVVFLFIIAIVLISVRRYRQNRSSRGTNSTIPQPSPQPSPQPGQTEPGTSHATEQDGYCRKERQNGDRVIEKTMEDAATSNADFKCHEHKTFENSAYVSDGYDNEGIEIEDSGERG